MGKKYLVINFYDSNNSTSFGRLWNIWWHNVCVLQQNFTSDMSEKFSFKNIFFLFKGEKIKRILQSRIERMGGKRGKSILKTTWKDKGNENKISVHRLLWKLLLDLSKALLKGLYKYLLNEKQKDSWLGDSRKKGWIY